MGTHFHPVILRVKVDHSPPRSGHIYERKSVAREGPADAAAEPFDHRVSPAWRYSPDHVARLLGLSGVTEVARLVIAPGEDPARGFPQAHLLARRAA